MKRFLYMAVLLMPSFVQAVVVSTDVAADIVNQIEQLDPSRTLVVFDIDNTLLAPNTELGSEQWYDWQRSMMASKGFQNGQITNNPKLFFSIVDQINATTEMHLVDKNWPGWISELQSNRYTVIVETSRNYTIANETISQLKKNGLDFNSAKLVEGSNPEHALRLTASEYEAYKVDLNRGFVYQDGVYLTSGLHKGAMLRKLLDDLHVHCQFRNIVFIDNDYHLKHLKGIEDAFQKFPEIKVYGYQYTVENKVIDHFIKDDSRKTKTTNEFFYWWIQPFYLFAQIK